MCFWLQTGLGVSSMAYSLVRCFFLLETGLGVSSMSYSLVGTLSETDSEIVAINFVARGGIFIVVSLPNVQRCICRGVSISFVRISQPTLKDWKWL